MLWPVPSVTVSWNRLEYVMPPVPKPVRPVEVSVALWFALSAESLTLSSSSSPPIPLTVRCPTIPFR